MYIVFALLSALFSSITALLSKKGLKGINSHLAVLLRTTIVFFIVWGIAFVTGATEGIRLLSERNLIFLALSGIATGISWLCYYQALAIGDVNKVVAVDKSSTTLTMLIGMFFLSEAVTPFKIIGMIIMTVGTYLMLEKKDTTAKKGIRTSWLLLAILSAVFASLTSIFAKTGLSGVNSNFATAFRTSIVLIFAALIFFLRERHKKFYKPTKKNVIFLILSAFATGASWLCYFYALSIGEAGIVAPIDKLSVTLAIILSWIFLHERITRKSLWGLVLLTIGVILPVL